MSRSSLSGHLLVEKHEVERTPAHELRGIVRIGGGLNLEPLVAQEDAVRLEQLRLVIHPENGLGLVRHRSNVAPRPSGEQRAAA